VDTTAGDTITVTPDTRNRIIVEAFNPNELGDEHAVVLFLTVPEALDLAAELRTAAHMVM
jgi:hypothetical protein